MNKKEIIEKRFSTVEDLYNKIFTEEITIKQALLAMSYIAQSGFE